MAKILVVEDDSIVADMLKQMLERESHDVTVSENGKQALKILQEEQFPDLIITDVVMPEKDGIEFVRSVRRQNKQIKIIAISGGGRYLDPDYVLQTIKLFGVDIVLSKPLDRQNVLESIDRLLNE